MYFNVSQLLREPSGSARAYKESETVLLPGTGEKCELAGIIRLLRTDRGVWVSAVLSTEVSCECSRCLLQMRQPVHMEIEEEFLPQIDIMTGARLHKPDDFDEEFYIDQDHVLDITECARQYIQMNAPMKPVCSADCAGICMNCGMNLNDFDCACDKVLRDPRWDTLVELMSSSKSDN